MLHLESQCFEIYMNNDSGLTLTYFIARSNLVLYSLGAESRKKIHAKHFGYKLATGLHLKKIQFSAIPRGLPTGNC